MKIVIIGNSGSGKTWLAEKLCNEKIKLFHLDQFYWEPGGFDIRRGKTEITTLIKKSLQNTEWVVEGVFGELVNYYTPEAKELVWLDMPWALCHKRLIQRGSESKRHMNRTQSNEGLKKLIEWAQNYYIRTDSKSRIGHNEIYDSFKGIKTILQSQEETCNYLKNLHNKKFWRTPPTAQVR